MGLDKIPENKNIPKPYNKFNNQPQENYDNKKIEKEMHYKNTDINDLFEHAINNIEKNTTSRRNSEKNKNFIENEIILEENIQGKKIETNNDLNIAAKPVEEIFFNKISDCKNIENINDSEKNINLPTIEKESVKEDIKKITYIPESKKLNYQMEVENISLSITNVSISEHNSKSTCFINEKNIIKNQIEENMKNE